MEVGIPPVRVFVADTRRLQVCSKRLHVRHGSHDGFVGTGLCWPIALQLIRKLSMKRN
ncbi:MAG TPA: hypothetical protein VG269_07440 [Tepidisphaeraceae bacterium]|nr:hypothetical protein [Tepidisphaeraceae bacterium]